MRLLSPAKINLFLQILRKRPDGYHDLETLMCCIGLYDHVFLDFNTTTISVSCNHPQVPRDHTNVAYRAARLFLNRIKTNAGVGITIDKRIPVDSGLGGGSSNAATVLLGLNQHYGNPLSRKILMELAAATGSDVPFFIDQKPAIATGSGNILDAYNGLEPGTAVVIFPSFGISTAEMYKKFDLRLTKEKEKIKVPSFKNKRFNIEQQLYNDFEKVAVESYPETARIKNILLKNGAAGALMSGSGSAVYGLFRDRGRAEQVCFALNRQEGWQLFVTDLIL